MKKLIKLLVLLAIIVSPFGSSALSVSLGSFQLTLYRICLALSFILLILDSLLHNGKVKLCSSGNRASVKFMLVWLLYSIITVLWIKDFNEYIKYEFFILTGISVLILFINIFENEYDIYIALKAFSLGAAIQACIGWYEFFTGTYLFVAESRVISIINHELVNIPVAMLYNPNDFGTLMFFGAFTSYIAVKREDNRLSKVIFTFIMVSCAILLICTKSTSCIIGLIIGIAVILLLSSKEKAAIATLASVGILFIPQVSAFLSARVSFVGNAASNSVRLQLIKNGFGYLFDTFGFGIGTGQQTYWLNNYGFVNLGNVEQFHNWWLEILFIYGWFIFAAYMLFYFRLFRAIYLNYRISKSVISLGAIAIMSGYIITAVSSSSNFRTEPLWAFWGILITYQGIMDQ